MSIQIAYQQSFNTNEVSSSIELIENKTYKIKFCGKLRQLLYFNRKCTKWQPVKFIDTMFYNQLLKFCIEMIDGGHIQSPIQFLTRHKRFGTIFKAHPIYKENEYWYDWATVNWDVETFPAKFLLFIDININNFLKPFTVGSTTVTEQGMYALCYSLDYRTKIKAHTTSYLVSYGKIMLEKDGKSPALCMFLLDAIENNISAVPFNTSNGIDSMNGKEWLFLCSKSEWYDIFIKFMKDNK